MCLPGLPVHEHGGLPHAGPRPHLLHLDPDGDRLDAPQHRHGHLPRHGHHRFQARLYNTGYLYITILIYISIGATIINPSHNLLKWIYHVGKSAMAQPMIIVFTTQFYTSPCRGVSGSQMVSHHKICLIFLSFQYAILPAFLPKMSIRQNRPCLPARCLLHDSTVVYIILSSETARLIYST